MDYTTDELRKHFGNKSIFGQIGTVVRRQGALASGFKDASGQKMHYPDGRAVDDIWLPLAGAATLKKNDWVLVEDFEASYEGAVADGRSCRITATRYVRLLEINADLRPSVSISGLNIVGNHVLVTPDLFQRLSTGTENEALSPPRQKRLTQQEDELKAKRVRLDREQAKLKDEHDQLQADDAAFQETLENTGFEVKEGRIQPSFDLIRVWLDRPEVIDRLRREKSSALAEIDSAIEEKQAEAKELDSRIAELRLRIAAYEAVAQAQRQEKEYLESLKRDIDELAQLIKPSSRGRTLRDRAVPIHQFASERDLIAHVKQYIRNSGFHYDDHIVENFYTCLKADYLIVLSGISGVGKSRLPALFAEALDGVFESIPVRSDWNDDRDLLGFFDFERKAYQSTRFLDLLLDANLSPDRLYIVCFDEMNLAPVEYYFAQFLSVLERSSPTLAPPDEALTAEAIDQFGEKALIEMERLQSGLVSKSGASRDADLRQIQLWSRLQNDLEKYQSVLVPPNVKFVGTVNVDHTTHGFSDKVLDRANVIQFERAALKAPLKKGTLSIQGLSYRQFGVFCKEAILTAEQARSLESYRDQVREINQILDPAGLSIGFRVLQQIGRYMHLAIQGDYFNDLDVAFDFQIKQRILPKLRGMQSAELNSALLDLNTFLQEKGYQQSNEKIAGRKRPGAEKAFGGMLQQLGVKGYVNYWETR